MVDSLNLISWEGWSSKHFFWFLILLTEKCWVCWFLSHHWENFWLIQWGKHRIYARRYVATLSRFAGEVPQKTCYDSLRYVSLIMESFFFYVLSLCWEFCTQTMVEVREGLASCDLEMYCSSFGWIVLRMLRKDVITFWFSCFGFEKWKRGRRAHERGRFRDETKREFREPFWKRL